jgi:curved DNA-binding protein CbpA
MARTFYDVMMLSPAADSRLITVVYRHLAKRYHPDVDPSPEAAVRMAELNEAYAVLIDRTRRDHYDELLGLGAAPSPTPIQPSGPASAVPSGATATDSEAASASRYGEAGPPPVNPAPTGSTLTFGRYRGWTLNQVGRVDRDYLEWLSRTTMGRTYRRELDDLLRR